MTDLAAESPVGGGEGFDPHYAPDRILRAGEWLQFGATRIEVLETPGHTGCHLGFVCDGRLFSGDTVMGWSTSLISPPDGDMTMYMATLHSLAARDWHRLHPGHGPAVDAPARRLADLIAHRRTREAEVLATLSDLGPASARTLAARIYHTTPPALLPAASRNMLAHLIDLQARGLVGTPGPVTPDAVFAMCGGKPGADVG